MGCSYGRLPFGGSILLSRGSWSSHGGSSAGGGVRVPAERSKGPTARQVVLVALASVGMAACTSSNPTGPLSDAGSPDTSAPPATPDGGCATNGDCEGDGSILVCDTSRGQCVTPCTISLQPCDPTTHCDELTKACIPGCSSDVACTAEAGAPSRRCDLHAHTCVDCLDDVDCPSGALCVVQQCVPGCSALHRCPSGALCCDGACIDPLSDPRHCGTCDESCITDASTGVCVGGVCALACAQGYADCDHDPTNGCEVDTTNDPAHCGQCTTACPAAVPNGTVECAASQCRIRDCLDTFRDCDGLFADGCEANTATSLLNCGQCGLACAAPNACNGGDCGAAHCPPGLRDCDYDQLNTCETDILTSPANCGGCGLACSIPHGVGACSAGSCVVAQCTGTFADCDGQVANGCESDLTSDPAHCGSCTNACDSGVCGATLAATMDTYPTGWTFNGNAFYDVTTASAVLTAAEGQTSSILYGTPVAVDAFDLSFDFRIGGGAAGANGLGFILETNGPNAIGTGARGIGMSGLSGYGIEFDTFPDLSNIGPCEPQTEHIGFDDLFDSLTSDVYCQELPNARSTNASLPFELRNSGWHAAQVHWSAGTVRVAVDGAVVLPTYTIGGFVAGTAYYVGFVAASGILRDRHEVRNVHFDFATGRCL